MEVNLRDKMFIEYPLCLSYDIAIAWMKAGHELWQECTEDWPECAGFDDIECFRENFLDGHLDYSDAIHLVPIVPEKSREPQVGDVIASVEDVIGLGMQNKEDGVEMGDEICIDEILPYNFVKETNKHQFYLEGIGNQYGSYTMESFVFLDNCLPMGKSPTEEMMKASEKHLKKYNIKISI